MKSFWRSPLKYTDVTVRIPSSWILKVGKFDEEMNFNCAIFHTCAHLQSSHNPDDYI